jgi:hypothetical protein
VLDETRFGRPHQHSADATPLMVRRDCQGHDLTVETVVIVKRPAPSSDETDDVFSLARDQRVVVVVAENRSSRRRI